jgi:hypothetical protein
MNFYVTQYRAAHSKQPVITVNGESKVAPDVSIGRTIDAW